MTTQDRFNGFSRSVRALFAVALMGVVVAGCAPTRSGDVYQRGETLRAQTVEMGVVDSIRFVQIDGRDTGVGTVGGAALGGIAGSTIGGGGRANTAGAIAGAILGGVVGNAVERDVTRGQGVELTVRLDNGRTLAVVQDATQESFRPGGRARVLSDGRSTRVSH
ncbi:MAG: glycine zipper 2TM domain-containing protein [Pseudomonadota bacterium]|nr:glycine zipper 2TM domain-containing protein [Pseudomonadota bacterium]